MMEKKVNTSSSAPSVLELRETRKKRQEMLKGASFVFAFIPVKTAGVDLDGLTSAFMYGVFKRIRDMVVNPGITALTIAALIQDPAVSNLPDSITFKRKLNEIQVAINIPFHRWLSTDKAARIDLLADVILEGVNRIPIRHLAENHRQQIRGAVEEVRRELKKQIRN
jgi:hypothetical protein